MERRFFLDFGKQIVEDYDELFNTTRGSDSNTIGGRQEGFNSKYAWYKELHALADGSALRINEATLIPIHEAFTWLQYEKEKTLLENELIKRKFKK